MKLPEADFAKPLRGIANAQRSYSIRRAVSGLRCEARQAGTAQTANLFGVKIAGTDTNIGTTAAPVPSVTPPRSSLPKV